MPERSYWLNMVLLGIPLGAGRHVAMTLPTREPGVMFRTLAAAA